MRVDHGARRSAGERGARRSQPAAIAAIAAGLTAAIAALACSPSPADRVLVVANGNSPVSQSIADYYAQRREVPATQRIELDVPLRDPALGDPADERISRADFVARIRDPIGAWLDEREWRDHIRIIVLAKGIPLRIEAAQPSPEVLLRDAEGASVDAELSLLFSGLDGRAGVAETPNPYYESPLPFDRFRAFHADAPLRYLVARLTGYQGDRDPETGVPAAVQALIDAPFEDAGRPPVADATGATGAPIWLIDQSDREVTEHAAANRALLDAAAAALRALGQRVEHDTGPRFVSDAGPIQGYASWGSNDPASPDAPTYGRIDGIEVPGRFAPRSIALDLVSTSARSFRAPPRYGQSLIADLLRLGAAGAAGHVQEPTLAGVARPHILFWHYARGATAIEAYYRSLPYLGWQNVWIGDPLMKLPAAWVAETREDRDGDGHADHSDNCLAQPNPLQRDSDGDGFGNRCDPDVDGDGVVTTSWGQTTPAHRRGDLEWIALAARQGQYDEKLDLDLDGVVDAADVSIATLWLFLPPGPSGLAAPPRGTAAARQPVIDPAAGSETGG